MPHAITTHDADGKAIFSIKVPIESKEVPIPLGRMTILYSTHSFPEKIEDDQDLAQYLQDREGGFGPGVACPPSGTCGSILHLAPGLHSPMRKQPTIGVFYILEGEPSLLLDSGESRDFRPGDSGVLRDAMHSWSNKTDGWVKLINFSQSLGMASS